MFRLKTGYLISIIITGFVLLISFVTSLPDNKLHIVFCDVGQGDAIYIILPDGRDMLIDGGPNNKVLECLGRFMPFWDRKIDMVVLTHPQKDHLQGLLGVLERFKIDKFVYSGVNNQTQGFQALSELVADNNISYQMVNSNDYVNAGAVNVSVLWPSERYIGQASGDNGTSILGAFSAGNPNDFSIVLHLSYGDFDAVLTGDADNRVNSGFISSDVGGDRVEVLKVPHHGSKTGMNEDMADWLNPELAVISVGKNSYGHPAEEILKILEDRDIKVLRTDEAGDIEIISDGRDWKIE